MKIGFYDPYLDTLGGGEKYILKAAKCFEEKSYIFWDISKEREIKEKAKQRFNLDLSKINFVQNIFNKNSSFVARFSVNSYDSVFYLSDGSIPFLPFAKKFIIHFQFPVEWVRGKSLATKLKLLRVAKVVCNSEYTKKFIDREFGVESIVIYPPSQIISSKDKKKENIILTAGRFAKTEEGRTFKKHDFLIELFKEMVDKGLENWEFHIATIYKKENEEDVKKMENSVKNYPIRIHRNIPDDEIKNLYASAKIYWHAAGYGEDLNIHPEYAEHFGITTVEAMSFGAVPVVVDAGGQTEIVENGEEGFLWNKKEELMDFTLKLVKDKELFGRLSEKAIQKSSKFSEENFNKQIIQLIG